MEPKKRPFPEENEIDNLISCVTCNSNDKDVMVLSTCGCLFCELCILNQHETCSKCGNSVSRNLQLKFEKGKLCKYHERGCLSGAQFICKCIKEGFLCGSCLTDVHVRMIEQPCKPVPINFTFKKSVNCQDCKVLVAEFTVKESKKNVCMDCKSNYKELEKIIHEHENISNNIDKDFSLTKRIMNCKSQKIATLLSQRQNVLQAEELKVEEAIKMVKKNFMMYKSLFEKESESLKKQHDQVKKIEDQLAARGIIERIVVAAQKNLVNIHGGEKHLLDLFSWFRNINVLSFPITRSKFVFTPQENLSMDFNAKYENNQEINQQESSGSVLLDYQEASTSFAITPRKELPCTSTPFKASRALFFEDTNKDDSLIIIPELEPVALQKHEPAHVK